MRFAIPLKKNNRESKLEVAPTLIIKPRKGLQLLNLKEIWTYHELLYFLAWRDIKVKYKQTVIGVLWVVLQPIIMVLIFTIFFGKLARFSSDGVPYALFALSALIPWQLFSRVLLGSTSSLVNEQHLISKVYFPRIIIPIATSISALFDFAISFVVLIAVMLYYETTPTLALLWLPIFVILMIITSLGIGLWLSALNVEFRDIGHALPFLEKTWFFLTPIVYSTTLVPQNYLAFYSLNPMVGVIEGFRWVLLNTSAPSIISLATSSGVAVLLLITGIFWFRSRESTLADSLG